MQYHTYELRTLYCRYVTHIVWVHYIHYGLGTLHAIQQVPITYTTVGMLHYILYRYITCNTIRTNYVHYTVGILHILYRYITSTMV